MNALFLIQTPCVTVSPNLRTRLRLVTEGTEKTLEKQKSACLGSDSHHSRMTNKTFQLPGEERKRQTVHFYN